jgi:hypothetical protein
MSSNAVAIDVIEKPTTDWGKVEAYYTQRRFSVGTAIKPLCPTTDTCVFTQLDIDHVRAGMYFQALDLMHFCDATTFNAAVTCKNLMLLLPASNLTTDVFPIIHHGPHVRVKPNNALWLYHDLFERVIDPLKGYDKYQTANWDGYGAEAITAATLDYARRLMKAMPTAFGRPDVAPAADGTIALEWVPDHHHKLCKLFLDIGPGEEWTAYWKLRNDHFDTVTHRGFEPTTTSAILKDLFDHLSK